MKKKRKSTLFKQKLSIIVPCYNSGKYIRNNIIKLTKILNKSVRTFELILINDGSRDETSKKILELKKNFKKIRFYNFNENKGKSHILKKTFKVTKYQNIIFIDSDLPYLKNFREVLLRLDQGYDFIFIDRANIESKLKKVSRNNYQIIRHFIGRSISKIISLFLDTKLNGRGIDTQAGLKGFKKLKNFNKLEFISNKFFLDIELIHLFLRRDKRLFSIPTEFVPPTNSSIGLFSTKNIYLLYEFIKVIIKLKFF